MKSEASFSLTCPRLTDRRTPSAYETPSATASSPIPRIAAGVAQPSRRVRDRSDRNRRKATSSCRETSAEYSVSVLAMSQTASWAGQVKVSRAAVRLTVSVLPLLQLAASEMMWKRVIAPATIQHARGQEHLLDAAHQRLDKRQAWL